MIATQALLQEEIKLRAQAQLDNFTPPGLEATMENTLRQLVKNQAALARDVGVSTQTVRNWLELNAIPPRRIIDVANALGVELTKLLPFA